MNSFINDPFETNNENLDFSFEKSVLCLKYLVHIKIMKTLENLLIALVLVLVASSESFAQNSPASNMSFEQMTEWLTENLEKSGNFRSVTVYGDSESNISKVDFDGCKALIKIDSAQYPKYLESNNSMDFIKNERNSVSALKTLYSSTSFVFSLQDLDYKRIEIDQSPDKKIVGRNNKVVVLTLPAKDDKKVIEYTYVSRNNSIEKKNTQFGVRMLLFIKPEPAEQISRVFRDVIEKCQ